MHSGREAVVTKCVITDFGFACAEGSDDTMPGTIKYLAPETIRGDDYSRPADIWATGVTLMELWTGKPVVESINDDKLESLLAEVFIHISELISIPHTRKINTHNRWDGS